MKPVRIRKKLLTAVLAASFFISGFTLVNAVEQAPPVVPTPAAGTQSGIGFPPPMAPPPPPLGPGPGQAPMDMGAMAVMPPIEVVSPGVVNVGGVKVIKQEGRVEFPATVNMNQGLIEYLVVGTGGKLHESLLQTSVEPYALQIALLLSGLEGTNSPLFAQGEDKKPTGDPVSISISWDDKGAAKKVAIEEWVKKNDKPAGQLPWVFTGSVMNNGAFLAQVSKSILAVYHDPAALIDHQAPEGKNDEVWFADPEKVQPVGTKVKVTIEKVKKEK